MLRDFDREGYAKGGKKFYEVEKRVKNAISENIKRQPKGKLPRKWLRRVKIDDSGDGKLKKLAGLMTMLVEKSSRSRIVRDVARAIVRGYDVEPKDFANELWALQHWIQNNIRYVFDTGEQFQTPQRQLLDWYNGHDGADCDCLTMLYLAMAHSLGHTKLAIGLLDGRGDGTISHAIALVKLPRPKDPWGHKWIPIELTKRVPFGWLTHNATKLVAVPVSKYDGGR